jgi:Mn2+/Fe2+ NRAMP family transporter
VVVAAPLFANHGDVSKMNTGADFATALQPLIGTGGATLFALGIIKSGSVSRGRWFYGVTIISVLVAAGVVLVPGTPLVALTLTVNVIATMFMAPALLLLLLLVNDREIMGTHANGWGMNLAGSTIVIGIALVGAFYGVITVFPHLLTTGA